MLGSPAVDALHVDASEHLWTLHSQIDDNPGWKVLREVANGIISYASAVSQRNGINKDMGDLLRAVFDGADVLCATPAGIEHDKLYRKWRDHSARGVAIDEAHNMHQPGFFSLWGNCLLPCFLCGDMNGLPLEVLAMHATWERVEGRPDANPGASTYVSRFAHFRKISPLLFFMAMGMPVYRLEW